MLLKAFRGSIVFAIGGLVAAYWFGGGLSALFLCLVLSILEVSLSFDNAVVNASVLTRMTPLWRERFLTWGIWIAVFGMRLVLPLLIVGLLAQISPWSALILAIERPSEYAALMLSIHPLVAAFGGTFLWMVGLDYFIDHEKEEHWIRFLEKPISKLGRFRFFRIGLTSVLLGIIGLLVSSEQRTSFYIAGFMGAAVFIIVNSLGSWVSRDERGGSSSSTAGPVSDPAILARASFGLFIYLEILDASFSFDGVIGAFALTQSLFLIAIGLGIGAVFVRSMTIVLVEKGTLAKFQYLEHGAFWAILSLAVLMFTGLFTHVPEVITGLVGAILIGLSVISSLRARSVE